VLSCASLKAIVALSHASQLSVSYPQEAQRKAIEHGHEGIPSVAICSATRTIIYRLGNTARVAIWKVLCPRGSRC
jgi:hypothetical protein